MRSKVVLAIPNWQNVTIHRCIERKPGVGTHLPSYDRNPARKKNLESVILNTYSFLLLSNPLIDLKCKFIFRYKSHLYRKESN